MATPSSVSAVRDLVARYLDGLQDGTGPGLDDFCRLGAFIIDIFK